MIEQLTLVDAFRVVLWAVLICSGPILGFGAGEAAAQDKGGKAFAPFVLAFIMSAVLAVAAYIAGVKS
jgi:hypothetical protein